MIIRLHKYTDKFPDDLIFVLFSITESFTQQIYPGDEEITSFKTVSYGLRHDFVTELGFNDTHYIDTNVPVDTQTNEPLIGNFPLESKFIFKHDSYLAEGSAHSDSKLVRYAYIKPLG